MRLQVERKTMKALLRLISQVERRQRGGAPSRYFEQIKGRNFEVPGCGGFLLTGEADNLGDYYARGTEVATFSNIDEMVSQIRHYLSHEDERQTVAAGGYARTMREHTYVHRFAEIFDRMGLPHPLVDEILAGKVSAGRVDELA
jgi:spore maturation protein CgeB